MVTLRLISWVGVRLKACPSKKSQLLGPVPPADCSRNLRLPRACKYTAVLTRVPTSIYWLSGLGF